MGSTQLYELRTVLKAGTENFCCFCFLLCVNNPTFRVFWLGQLKLSVLQMKINFLIIVAKSEWSALKFGNKYFYITNCSQFDAKSINFNFFIATHTRNKLVNYVQIKVSGVSWMQFLVKN